MGPDDTESSPTVTEWQDRGRRGVPAGSCCHCRHEGAMEPLGLWTTDSPPFSVSPSFPPPGGDFPLSFTDSGYFSNYLCQSRVPVKSGADRDSGQAPLGSAVCPGRPGLSPPAHTQPLRVSTQAGIRSDSGRGGGRIQCGRGPRGGYASAA